MTIHKNKIYKTRTKYNLKNLNLVVSLFSLKSIGALSYSENRAHTLKSQ